MAEASLLLVIAKIGSAVGPKAISILANKADAVVAIPNDMTLIRNQLELLHAFLMDTERRGISDQLHEAWICQARRLAHHMEDIVDQFIYVVGTNNQNAWSWFSCMKRVVKRPQHLYTLDQIANEIKLIKLQLEQLKRDKDWIQPIPAANDFPARSYDLQPQVFLFDNEMSVAGDELVGLAKNREILMKSLHLDCPGLRMISVCGMGGIGKSTLVKDVYKKEASNFECHVWVSVSQSYKLDEIWTQILKKINVEYKQEYDLENMSSEELQVKVKENLHNRRYLIILDDVWTATCLWKIKNVLIDDDLGSRVIITTRMQEVALVADDGCNVNVMPLEHNDAWLLFCMKAFPKTENHICPPDLLEYGEGIVQQCGGLPLALVAVGCILSLKRKIAEEWKFFMNLLIWELHNNENITHVEKVLNLSYKHLPSYLKNCVLYCAIFPENFAIEADYLIKLWISEGLIEQRGACSFEDVAQEYLIELVRRNMLQVSARNSFGKIKYLRMHDLVRELAIFRSRKENFSSVYDCTRIEASGLISRRIGVHKGNADFTSSMDISSTRTILCFDTNLPKNVWSAILHDCKYIAVLDLSNLGIEVIPESIGNLFNLRFLNFDVNKVMELPKSVKNLQRLETLSLDDTGCLVLPQETKNLKKLRHVIICKILHGSELSFNTYESFGPFEGLWCLNELRTLQSVRATEVLVSKLGNLCKLRYLTISEVRSIHCEKLCDSLSNMLQLESLTIRAINALEVLRLETLNLRNPLQKLCLEGKISPGSLGSLFFSTHGHKLFELSLFWCRFTEDPLLLLSGFSKLTYLDLRRAYIGEKINFQAGWYPDLKVLRLRNMMNVDQISVEEGALGNLDDLIIHRLKKLRAVPRQLNSLKYANFTDLHRDFRRQN